MTPPKRLPQVRKLLKEDSRTDPLQPLHDAAYIHMPTVCHQHVNVVACHLPRHNRDLVLHRYLPDQIAHPNRHLSCQYPLPILRYPHQMDFQIMLRVRAQLISFHATTLHDPILRLQGEGFPPSPGETLKQGSARWTRKIRQGSKRRFKKVTAH